MQLTQRTLSIVAILLAVIAVSISRIAWTGHNVALSLTFWLIVLLLLDVPALAMHINGQPRHRVFLAAIGVPLACFELCLGVAALMDDSVGGDVQGIERQLMFAIIVPVALTGAIVAALACRFIRPVQSHG